MVVGTINPYPFFAKGIPKLKQEDYPKVNLHKFTFKDKKQVKYIVEVEVYDHNVYAMKFYVKTHSPSPFRYNKMTGNRDARRIIDTCLQIGVEFYKKNDLISFCFIGAPTQEEYDRSGYLKTKRFRVYAQISKFLLNPETFTHTEVTESSFYILMNNKAVARTPDLFERIKKMFNTHYTIEQFFPDLVSLRKTELSRSCQRLRR